jgi:hypothetical protein
MNEEVLVGPIWNLKKLLRFYERNKELYGELNIISMSENKEIKYLNLGEIK